MPRATSPGLAPEPVPEIQERLVLRDGNRAQRRAILVETAIVWRGQLSADEYVGLSLMSDLDPFGAEMSYKVMVDKRDEEVYASAELWHRRVLAVLPGETKVTELKAACLHHLFVPQRYRNHGLGKIFLKHLLGWAKDNYDLCYGFAQVGEGVFRNAWSRWTSRTLGVFSPSSIAPYAGTLQVRPIALDDVPALLAIDEELLKQELLASGPVDHPRMAVPVDMAALKMFLHLDSYRCRMQNKPELERIGWMIGSLDRPHELAFCLIRPFLIENTLSVLRTRTPTPEHMHALLSATARFAIEHGFGKIRCHGDSPAGKANHAGMVDHKAMLATSGVEDLLDDDPRCGVLWLNGSYQEVDWLAIQMGTACSALAGVPQKVLVNEPRRSFKR